MPCFKSSVQDYCIQLLAEDPAREIRRRQLRQERETLFKAQMEVRELEEKFAIRGGGGGGGGGGGEVE